MGSERKSLTQAIEKVAEDVYREKEKEKNAGKDKSEKMPSKDASKSE